MLNADIVDMVDIVPKPRWTPALPSTTGLPAAVRQCHTTPTQQTSVFLAK